MSRRPKMPAALAGGILILAAAIIVLLKQTDSGSHDAGEKPDAPPANVPSEPVRADSDESAARDLLAELTSLRNEQQPIPQDLKLRADKLIKSKRAPYDLRIQLALAAMDDHWAAKHIQIIFRNEISKRPFETIAELYKLVPEGELRQQVVESTFQTTSLTSSDAPAAVAFLESIPPAGWDRVVSLIGSRLSETKDLATMRALEASSRSEDLKNRFQWWVAKMEKETR
jgi:hypothetical protein